LIYAAKFAKGKCGLLEIKLSPDNGHNDRCTDDEATVKADLGGVGNDVEMAEELVYIGKYLGEGKRVNEADGAEDGKLAATDGGCHEERSGRTPFFPLTIMSTESPIVVAPRPVRLNLPDSSR
jgi:hypothetical protein